MGTVFNRTKPDAMPALPKPDADGHISATESTRISLARSIICERTALGLTQEQLAKLAGRARRVGEASGKGAGRHHHEIRRRDDHSPTHGVDRALGEFTATMRAAGRSLAESRSSGDAAFESAAAETSTRPRDS